MNSKQLISLIHITAILPLILGGCAAVAKDAGKEGVAATATGGPVQITYSFTEGRRPTLGPTSGVTANLTASQMAVFAMIEGAEAKMSTNRGSSGYDGASGQYHVFLNELNPASTITPFTPYLSFTLEPAGNLTVALTGFHFGARSLCDPVESGSASSGPTRFAVRTSADGFSGDVFAGEFNGSRGSSNFWYRYGEDNLAVVSGAGNPLEIRLYLLGATGEERAGVFRIDDVIIRASTRP